MAVCTCPNRELLQLYVRGCLDRAGHDTIEQHLDTCIVCSRAVETLDAMTPAPFPVGTSLPTQGPAIDDSFRHLIASVKAMRTGNSTVAGLGRGAVLGNYELLEPLGAGGMGRVFKAWHRRLQRVVALKLLAPELLRSEAARARFRREAHAAARLSSPHVVAVHDAGEDAGHDFLVMEYIEGQSLAERVKAKGSLPVADAVRYAQQATRGLSHAHAAGIIHRDVKPANLLLDRTGTVKVLDLGLARRPEEAGDVTTSGVVVGTAGYMAPEQAFDTRQVDHRADIYGLGCTLYFLLTGKPPFEGPTALETLLAHRERAIPSVRVSRPDCPVRLDRLVHAMMAKRPEDRPATMEAVASELDAVATCTSSPARPRHARRGALAAAAGVAALALMAVVLARPWGREPAAFPTSHASGPVAAVVAPTSARAPEAVSRPPSTSPRKVDPPEVKPVKIEPSSGPPREVPGDWVPVQPAEFAMGSAKGDPDAADDEKPRHRVRITRPFFLHRTKVTQEEYEAVMGTNPSAFARTGRLAKLVKGLDTRRHPVESISWLDAVNFCNKKSLRDGLPPYYRINGSEVGVLGGPGYRLPTEAEWELACRAGTTTRWSFGDDPAGLDAHAWHAGNSGGITHPVGLKRPNPRGLLDMHGNVSEWCWDRYAADAYRKARLSDPVGSSEGLTRVHRGGGWGDAPTQLRSAARGGLGISYKVLTIVGLRLARDVQP